MYRSQERNTLPTKQSHHTIDNNSENAKPFMATLAVETMAQELDASNHDFFFFDFSDESKNVLSSVLTSRATVMNSSITNLTKKCQEVPLKPLRCNSNTNKGSNDSSKVSITHLQGFRKNDSCCGFDDSLCGGFEDTESTADSSCCSEDTFPLTSFHGASKSDSLLGSFLSDEDDDDEDEDYDEFAGDEDDDEYDDLLHDIDAVVGDHDSIVSEDVGQEDVEDDEVDSMHSSSSSSFSSSSNSVSSDDSSQAHDTRQTILDHRRSYDTENEHDGHSMMDNVGASNDGLMLLPSIKHGFGQPYHPNNYHQHGNNNMSIESSFTSPKRKNETHFSPPQTPIRKESAHGSSEPYGMKLKTCCSPLKKFHQHPTSATSTPLATPKKVRFGDSAHVREYALTVGALTCVDDTCPIQLSWEHSPTKRVPLRDVIEQQHVNEENQFASPIASPKGKASKAMSTGSSSPRRLSIEERRKRIAAIQGISEEEACTVEYKTLLAMIQTTKLDLDHALSSLEKKE